MDRVHPAQPASRGRRLLVRLALLAFCGGLLLLLSSRPADAAERRGPGLLDPVGTTLKATAREVDSFAGRATGSGASTVAKATGVIRRTVAPPSRPAATAVRAAAATTVKRGGPAVTSPVRRVAPSLEQVTTAARPTTRSAGAAAKPVTRTIAGPLDRAAAPAARAAKPASGLLGRVAGATAGPVGRVLGAVADRTAPVAGRIAGLADPLAGPVLRPLGPTLASAGSLLAPVGSVLAPVVGPVGGLVQPLVPVGLPPLPVRLPLDLPGPAGPASSAPAGPVAHRTGPEGTGPPGLHRFVPAASIPSPARPAADDAGSPAARPVRSWPALTGAVSLPGVPASAELPAGGPDPLSTTTGAALGLAALAAVLFLLGPLGRGRARPERSGILSRSYLPLVSPA